VKVGETGIGGNNPVRIQTMITGSASDVEATVKECMKVADAGAELVRISVPTISEAEALGIVRQKLNDGGYTIPLVADVHFNPDVAECAARYVEKIRINPGNFTDRPALDGRSFMDRWDSDLAKQNSRFVSLLNVCREYGTALRIGVNHGSLSGRIVYRYGNSPEGMVASAMEFLKICKEQSFDRVIVSMKASNTRIMVRANRLLIEAMDARDMHYPLHLGVTEAGDGEDGRIRSAVGIGSLLVDGIGDTIRVSLTEAPENEIPVARELLRHVAAQYGKMVWDGTYGYRFYDTEMPERPQAVVLSDLSYLYPIYESDVMKLVERPDRGPAPDYIYIASSDMAYEDTSGRIVDDANDDFLFCDPQMFSLELMSWLTYNSSIILVVYFHSDEDDLFDQRCFFERLRNYGVVNPVIIQRIYMKTNIEQLKITAACDFGALMVDGLGDGMFLLTDTTIDTGMVADLCFRILQASGVRQTRTEYIACPGCGRTLFDLPETLQKVKDATEEFRTLKIAVMGCIVNGPGEMADADYGYVGAARGKVVLYKGREVMKRNIPQEDAVEELVSLIKNDYKP
jgi:(E)-4-hydroxy-3-methylbut-2-enyl-diphosphate synthase